MADQTTPTPGAVDNTSAQPAQVPVTGDQTQTPPQATQTPPAPKTPWFMERINQLTASKASAERTAAQVLRDNEMLRAELERSGRLPAQQQTPNQVPLTQRAERPMSQADIERLVDERAAQRVTETRFAEASNQVYDAGKKYAPDFDTSLQSFQGFDAGQVRGFLSEVVHLPDAHKVIYALGKDPNEASRILSLKPFQQAVAIAELRDKVAKNPQATISNAPPPITPIDTSGKPARSVYDADASVKDWMALRREQTKRKR